MMYPRLKLARNLLREDGVIFISIDEKEYTNLHAVCTDIFGEENVLGTIVWVNATDNNPTRIATEHEYLLVISKNQDFLEKEWKSAISDVKDVLVEIGQELGRIYKGNDLSTAYNSWYREHKGELWPLDRYKYIDEGGVYTGSQSVHNPGKEGYRYDVIHPRTSKPCKQPLMGYRFPKHTMDDLLAQGRILFGEDESKIIELKVYAAEYQEKLSSLLELDGRLGAYDLRQDFPESIKAFNNPKPVRLLTSFFPYLLRKDGDIVLDFFAGSGTTAKATYFLNARDNVQRQFILVQLPEPLDTENKEQKNAAIICDQLNVPRTIAELTKERLRRAAKKVQTDNPAFTGDLGFRVYKLDSTNIRPWDPDPQDVAGSLFAAQEHLKDGRSEQDILTELLLKLGLPLTVPIEERAVGSYTLYAVGAGTLLACLAPRIEKDEVETLAQSLVAWQQELAPVGTSQVVLRDSGFRSDIAKANFTAILEQAGFDRRHIRSL